MTDLIQRVLASHILNDDDGSSCGFKFTFNYGITTDICFYGFCDAGDAISRAQWLSLCVPPGGANVSLVINDWNGESVIKATPDTTTFIFVASCGGPEGWVELVVPTCDCVHAFRTFADKASNSSIFKLLEDNVSNSIRLVRYK